MIKDSSMSPSKPPTRRTTGAIRDNIFIFQRITYWHPPIASFVSPLFNYFIPKGFSEQLFLKPKGSYKKKEATKKMRCCSPCHIALICINRYLFFYARHLHFSLSETGHPPQPRHTGQLRPARRGTLLDVAHDDRRVAVSARRFSPKRYTTDFRGLLPERWAPPYEVTLDSGRTGTFRA